MTEERNVNVIDEIEDEVVNTTAEISDDKSKKENFFKRGFNSVKEGVKKHPKLTAALALLAVGGVSYILGTKVKPHNEDGSTYDGETDLIGCNEDDEGYDEDDEDYDEEETFDEENEESEESVED